MPRVGIVSGLGTVASFAFALSSLVISISFAGSLVSSVRSLIRRRPGVGARRTIAVLMDDVADVVIGSVRAGANFYLNQAMKHDVNHIRRNMHTFNPLGIIPLLNFSRALSNIFFGRWRYTPSFNSRVSASTCCAWI